MEDFSKRLDRPVTCSGSRTTAKWYIEPAGFIEHHLVLRMPSFGSTLTAFCRSMETHERDSLVQTIINFKRTFVCCLLVILYHVMLVKKHN